MRLEICGCQGNPDAGLSGQKMAFCAKGQFQPRASHCFQKRKIMLDSARCFSYIDLYSTAAPEWTCLPPYSGAAGFLLFGARPVEHITLNFERKNR
jgi:hypothetical protein